MLTQSYRREIYYIITAEYFNIVIFVVWHFFYNQQRVPYCVEKIMVAKSFYYYYTAGCTRRASFLRQ